MDTKQFTINYSEEDEFEEKVTKMLQEWGVVIIEDVFDRDECKTGFEEILKGFFKISPDLKTAWIKKSLPPAPRAGLFQRVVGNLPPVWKVRSDKRLKKIFSSVYSRLRGYEINDFVTSIDGINIHPPFDGPYAPKMSEDEIDYSDWAHMDQTFRECDKPEQLCVQGQVVLNDSSACFRCSPGSHRVFNSILDMLGIDKKDKSNWCKFNSSNYSAIKNIVEEAGGKWQIPIRTKAGSVILWFSSTIHSAMHQSEDVELDSENPLLDWRAVVYVCYRPRNEVGDAHFKRLQRCFTENRLTNHWGSRMFGKNLRFSPDLNPTIEHFVEHPEKVYEIEGLKPELTEEVKSLIFPHSETST